MTKKKVRFPAHLAVFSSTSTRYSENGFPHLPPLECGERLKKDRGHVLRQTYTKDENVSQNGILQEVSEGKYIVEGEFQHKQLQQQQKTPVYSQVVVGDSGFNPEHSRSYSTLKPSLHVKDSLSFESSTGSSSSVSSSDNDDVVPGMAFKYVPKVSPMSPTVTQDGTRLSSNRMTRQGMIQDFYSMKRKPDPKLSGKGFTKLPPINIQGQLKRKTEKKVKFGAEIKKTHHCYTYGCIESGYSPDQSDNSSNSSSPVPGHEHDVENHHQQQLSSANTMLLLTKQRTQQYGQILQGSAKAKRSNISNIDQETVNKVKILKKQTKKADYSTGCNKNKLSSEIALKNHLHSSSSGVKISRGFIRQKHGHDKSDSQEDSSMSDEVYYGQQHPIALSPTVHHKQHSLETGHVTSKYDEETTNSAMSPHNCTTVENNATGRLGGSTNALMNRSEKQPMMEEMFSNLVDSYLGVEDDLGNLSLFLDKLDIQVQNSVNNNKHGKLVPQLGKLKVIQGKFLKIANRISTQLQEVSDSDSSSDSSIKSPRNNPLNREFPPKKACRVPVPSVV